MLRRHHRFFQSIQVLRDALVAGLAFGVAYLLRFHTVIAKEFFPETVPGPPGETLAILATIMVAWPVVGWFGGAYVSHRTRGVVGEIFEVFRISLVTLLVLVSITYFLRDERYSRATLIFWSGTSFFLVSVARLVSRFTLRTLRRRGYNLRHALVVGVGDLAQRVVQSVHRQSAMGMRVTGLVAPMPDADAVGTEVAGRPVLGTADELSKLLAETGADQVIVALPIDKLNGLKRIMGLLSQETVDVRLVPDVYQFVTLCGSIEEFGGLPIINLQSTPLMGWNLISKRVFDVAAAVFGLLVTAPLMLFIALWVRLSSPGPVLFRQIRVGMDGQQFTMFKFRTMRQDAEEDSTWTVEDDPRRTRVGTFLRKFSLDELPQLWNVLTGDMSLVGPRPEQPQFIEEFKKDIPRYALRHKIKAGMTGWAQINGMRGNTSITKRIELDLYYIENWSLLLDVKIIIRTIFGGFISPNAY